MTEKTTIQIRHFFETRTTLKVLVLAALLFDTVSTVYFMQRDGISFELHPIVRYSAMLWGPILGTFLSAFVFKAVVSFLLEAFYLRGYAVYMYLCMICASSFAGCYNFINTTAY